MNLWLYALARRIAALVNDESQQPLAELLELSESIIDRLPDSYRDNFTNTDLITYVKGDPDQIKSHSLRQTIHSAITRGL